MFNGTLILKICKKKKKEYKKYSNYSKYCFIQMKCYRLRKLNE